MSRVGIGLKLLVIMALYMFISWSLTRFEPQIFTFPFVPPPILRVSAIIMIIFGGVVQMAAAQVPARAFKEGRLVNTGIYSYIRHPMYAGWILLFVPGIALFFRSWLMVTTTLVGYIGFKHLIKAEDEYLTKKFGEAYMEYRSKVDELFPFNRLKECIAKLSFKK